MVSRTAGAGIALALATAAISGVAVFVNGYAVRELPDAALYTTLKNGAAAVMLLALAAIFVRREDLRPVSRRAWLGVGIVGIVGGSVPFVLFFSGLAMASAPSAAFIHKTLFIWVALLAVPLLRERVGALQIAALTTLLVSQLLLGAPSGVSWGMGETMIAAATLFWAIEAVLAKRLLASVPPPVLGAGRLGIGLIVLIAYLAWTGRLPLLAELSAMQWSWALLTGLILAGYVTTWLAALRRAPVTVTSSLLVLAAPITGVLDAVVKGNLPAPTQLGAYALILVAVAALVAAQLLRPRPALTLARRAT